MATKSTRLVSSRLTRAAAMVVGAMLAVGSPGFAFQQPASAPAAVGEAQTMSVVVAEIVGNANVSTDDGKTWKKATVGMTVSEGAQFRTGMKSSITCVIPPDQTFKLESLSTIRVAEAAKRGNKTRTDLILKYGAASYGIEKAGAEHESTIRTPSSTLAVRGTVVRVTDQVPFPPTAESFTGQAAYQALQRQTKLGGKGYAVVNAVQGSAADTAMAKSVVDPSAARARSNAEARLISEQVSRGALLSYDNQAMIPVVKGGPGPQSDTELAASLPGRLTFALRWSGNADLNFLVDNQPVDTTNTVKLIGALGSFSPQEILFPGYGLNVSTTGGLIPFDHRGGKNGGQEVAFWTNAYPAGIYGVAPLFVSGQSTEFRINAFLDGKAIPMFSLDTQGNLLRYTTYRGTEPATGSTVNTAIAIVPPNSIFDSFPSGDTDQQIGSMVRRALAQYDSQKLAATGPRVVGAAPTSPAKPLPIANFARPSTVTPAAKPGKQK